MNALTTRNPYAAHVATIRVCAGACFPPPVTPPPGITVPGLYPPVARLAG
ncbi:hypothetical protein [Rhodoferax sp.]|nr:hypothetical protein [Rhodoferax sp.]MDR3370995.1 hypothetical protein [Rhodoferax sp.]